jgi:hypothetical protein
LNLLDATAHKFSRLEARADGLVAVQLALRTSSHGTARNTTDPPTSRNPTTETMAERLQGHAARKPGDRETEKGIKGVPEFTELKWPFLVAFRVFFGAGTEV